jgi:hypothetical protein
MSIQNQRGSELNNVRETWDRNERISSGKGSGSSAPQDDLQQTIKEEAAEYDQTLNERKVLPGERATVSDEEVEDQADE